MISKKVPLFALILLVIVFSISMDIFIPGLPEIQREMQSTAFKAQLTLSIPVLVMSIGSLLLGRLSDLVGRRPVVLSFVLVFLLGTYLCYQARTMHGLHFGRFIQALGSAGLYVTAFAIARDITQTIYESSRVYSILMAAVSLSPLLAPLIGGVLIDWAGWRMTFLACFVLGLLVLASTYFYVKETLKERSKSSALKDYRSVVTSKNFIIYVIPISAGMACIFTYFSLSPFVLIEHFGVPQKHFGVYFAGIAVSFLIGCLLNGVFCRKVGIRNIHLIGALLFWISASFLFLGEVFFGGGVMWYILGLTPSGLGAAFFLSSGTAGALQSFDKIAGTAFAVAGLCEYAVAGITGSVASLFPQNTFYPIATVMLILGVTGFIPILFDKRPSFKK